MIYDANTNYYEQCSCEYCRYEGWGEQDETCLHYKKK